MRNWRRLGGACRSITVLVVATIALPSCTLLGASLGAAVDSQQPGPYEEHPRAQLVRLERDQDVLFVLRNGLSVAGRFRGVHGPTAADLERYLILTTDEGLMSVKESEVSSIGVEVVGKGWLYGALIGLAADATLVMLGAAWNRQMEDYKLIGSWH
jgi:hypothetical protein